ncbi:MAG: HlyD family efflux transporter periplasmic adaptor subunit [Rhodomicrobium sp.]|nr:HlyD family efflux transporter periplasmic adaptor subunit [Rhodomicrobium sp.]
MPGGSRLHGPALPGPRAARREKLHRQARIRPGHGAVEIDPGAIESAKADYEKAKQALEYKIDGDYAIIKEVEAALATAEYNLTQTTFYAPTDGYITNLQLTAGSYIKTGDPVLTFVDDDSWWVVANFRENSVGQIKAGQEAEVSLALYPGTIFKAVVESTDWGVSTGQGVPSGVPSRRSGLGELGAARPAFPRAAQDIEHRPR